MNLSTLKLSVILQLSGIFNSLIGLAYVAAGAPPTGLLILLTGLAFFLGGRKLLHITFRRPAIPAVFVNKQAA